MPREVAPIGEAEFSRAMQGFAPFSKKIALAVSGGPDSMALAFCAKRWAKAELIAFIVEHGLRDESPAEAQQVKQRLEGLGIPAEILSWRHGEVSSRLHEVAREARYRLLIEACRRHDVKDLLMAHQSEDQAETILMRLAKGSGIDGLAGIPQRIEKDGIRILRPFLSFSKQRLIATCASAGIAVVTDSSNAQEKYARGRLRKVMPLLEAEGLTVERLNVLGMRAREAREALDHATSHFLSACAETEIGGSVRLDREALRDIPRAIAMRALSACLRYVHDEGYPPEYDSLSALLDALLKDGFETRTFYGCMISPADKLVTILREPAAASEEIPIRGGQTLLWDGRWLVSARPDAPAGTVRALGNPPHEKIDAMAPQLRKLIPRGRIRAALPALWEGDVLKAIPSFDKTKSYSMAYEKSCLFPREGSD